MSAVGVMGRLLALSLRMFIQKDDAEAIAAAWKNAMEMGDADLALYAMLRAARAIDEVNSGRHRGEA